MRELRKDPATQRWVIISTERNQRPHQFISNHTEIPDDQENCPFCEGREYMTPPEIFSCRKAGSNPNEQGWDIRVVPDKEPILDPAEPMKKYGVGMFDAMRATGAHELVLETPCHRQEWGDITAERIGRIIAIYRSRINELKQDSRIKYVMVTKNHGVTAGAFLHHPHSHIVGLPIVPKRVQEELEGAELYYDYKERCVYCDMVSQELDDGVRLVAETHDFLAFCPFASRFPYEIWILPKNHNSHFDNINEDEVRGLALILRATILKLVRILDEPPFNLFLHSSTFDQEHIDHYHWHFELIPKLTKDAGFEWGSGFFINPTVPEEAAMLLRESEVEEKTE